MFDIAAKVLKVTGIKKAAEAAFFIILSFLRIIDDPFQDSL